MNATARCRHVKTNGLRCQSPALGRRDYCFFHARALTPPKAQLALPVLEDPNSIQLALLDLARLVAADRLEHKRAYLLLHILQTAAGNARHCTFEPPQLSPESEDASLARMLLDALGIDPDHPENAPKKPNTSIDAPLAGDSKQLASSVSPCLGGENDSNADADTRIDVHAVAEIAPDVSACVRIGGRMSRNQKRETRNQLTSAAAAPERRTRPTWLRVSGWRCGPPAPLPLAGST